MSIKKPYTIKNFEQSEAPALDENTRRLYECKVEARLFTDDISASASVIKSYQSIEHGQFRVSATGSATVVSVKPLKDGDEPVLYANAVCVSSLLASHVTDVTNTAITITTIAVSGSGQSISSITSGSLMVMYQVVRSSP